MVNRMEHEMYRLKSRLDLRADACLSKSCQVPSPKQARLSGLSYTDAACNPVQESAAAQLLGLDGIDVETYQERGNRLIVVVEARTICAEYSPMGKSQQAFASKLRPLTSRSGHQ